MQPAGNRNTGFFYGYVIVAAGFAVMVFLWATVVSFGLFVKPMSAELGWSRGATSTAYSMMMFFMGFLSMFAGSLNDRFGPRVVLMAGGSVLGLGLMLMSTMHSLWQLYLFFGFLAAVGVGSGYVPLSSTVARWFSRRRSLMTGIVLAGFGGGNLIGPLAVEMLMSRYGWRTSCFVMGLVTLVGVIIVAQFLSRDPAERRLMPYGASNGNTGAAAARFKDFSLETASYTRQFWIICLFNMTLGIGQMAISVHLVPYATDLGILTYVAASILAASGVANAAGRVGFGGLTDRVGVKMALVMDVTLVFIALAWLPLARSSWMLFLFAAISGLGFGGFPLIMSSMVAELFGMRSHGLILGVTTFAWGLGSALGPAAAGYIFDSTQSYRIAFIILAVIGAISLMLAVSLKPTDEGGWVKAR